MAELKKIEERTLQFIEAHAKLKGYNKMVTHEELAKIIGAESKSTISEILGKRQNIQPEQWILFKAHFKISTEYSVQSGSKSGIVSEDPVQYNKVNAYGDPAYLAGQLAMAERLIAKLESDHAEAKADKEKLFSVLAAAQNTINEVLKPIKDQTQEILTNSKELKENTMDAIIEMQSEHKAMMDTIDLAAKLPVGTTVGKADILEDAAQEIRKSYHKKKNVHKIGKEGQ